MLNDNYIFPGSIIFSGMVEGYVRGLNLQRDRIMSTDMRTERPNHDADFYMILLRRAYRDIEYAAKRDARVANLKGKYGHLYKKIKIRDHFEHGVDWQTLPSAHELAPNMKVACGVVVNEGNSHIVSGDQKWFLDKDHDAFIELLNAYAGLWPYQEKAEVRETFPQKWMRKLCRKFCSNRTRP